jgi:nucleoside diphosphate kinase
VPECTLITIKPDIFRRIILSGVMVKAPAGAIHGDGVLGAGRGTVRGSDSPDAAGRENKIFFPELV